MSVSFPRLAPAGMSYVPGEFPQTVFQSINGATSIVQFGGVAFNAELSLQFVNITDSQAEQILQVYESANGRWDDVDFQPLMTCIDAQMKARLTSSPLRWRFTDPPAVTYKFKSICDVRCQFTGYLDGA